MDGSNTFSVNDGDDYHIIGKHRGALSQTLAVMKR